MNFLFLMIKNLFFFLFVAIVTTKIIFTMPVYEESYPGAIQGTANFISFLILKFMLGCWHLSILKLYFNLLFFKKSTKEKYDSIFNFKNIINKLYNIFNFKNIIKFIYNILDFKVAVASITNEEIKKICLKYDIQNDCNAHTFFVNFYYMCLVFIFPLLSIFLYFYFKVKYVAASTSPIHNPFIIWTKENSGLIQMCIALILTIILGFIIFVFVYIMCLQIQKCFQIKKSIKTCTDEKDLLCLQYMFIKHTCYVGILLFILILLVIGLYNIFYFYRFGRLDAFRFNRERSIRYYITYNKSGFEVYFKRDENGRFILDSKNYRVPKPEPRYKDSRKPVILKYPGADMYRRWYEERSLQREAWMLEDEMEDMKKEASKDAFKNFLKNSFKIRK